MRHLVVAAGLVVLAIGLVPTASADLALVPITEPVIGESALEDYFGTDPFDPNNTAPWLQITGDGSVENTGGVALWEEETFTLDIRFLDDAYANVSHPSFENLLLTAAYQPTDGTFEKIRFFDPHDPSHAVEIDYDDFVDVDSFYFPFPPDGISGIGSGEADFMGLEGSRVAGLDLGLGLHRDAEATGPPTVRVGVEVIEPEHGPTVRIRFNVFGLNSASPPNIEGNNPASGSAGYIIPEPSSLGLLMLGALLLRRRARRR